MVRDLLDLCGKACKEAERKGVEAEAFAALRWELETEIEGTNITMGTGSTDFGVGIRVMKDKKVGFAYTSTPKHIKRTVRNAISASGLGSKIKFRFAPSARFRKVKGLFFEEVEALDAERAFSITRDVIDGARSVDKEIGIPSGGLLAGTERFAVVNTRGLEALQEGTIFSISASAVCGAEDKTSAFKSASSRTLDIDPHEIGMRAADLSRRLQGGKAFGKGKMDVVFTPTAFAELLSYTLTPSFYGEKVATGESYLKGMLGKRVAWKGLSIKDDALMRGGLGSSICDDEGARSRRNVLIKDGILKMFIYDIASAAKYGSKGTGNGLRPGFRGVPSTSSRNIVLEGRARPFDKIISGIDKGVLVHDIMGAHTANMASTDFSVNSSVLFMIKKGEVVHPISNAMLSGNLGDLLGRIGALGDDVRCVPSGAAYYLPSIWFKNVQVTG
jgi:PmbA protein